MNMTPQFQEGKEAFLGSKSKQYNPYQSGTVEFAQWNAGWDYQAAADTNEPE